MRSFPGLSLGAIRFAYRALPCSIFHCATAQYDISKRLFAVPRRAVQFAARSDFLERRRKLCGERIEVVARDRQTAAALGTVGGKRADHGVTASTHGTRDLSDVAFARNRIDEKMKHGAIMPKRITRRRQFDFGHITDDPAHIRARSAKPRSRLVHGSAGNIENADVSEASRKYIVNQAQGFVEMRTVPAGLCLAFLAIYRVPMRLLRRAHPTAPSSDTSSNFFA